MQRSHNLLHEMQKKNEEKEKKEEYQKLASRMIASAEGGTGLLRKITKPTARRGGVPILHEEENVKPSARCEEKRKELAKHWHSDTEVQVKKKKNRSWRNRELQSLEAGMPSLRQGEFEKAARSYKAKTGVGCDGFSP